MEEHRCKLYLFLLVLVMAALGVAIMNRNLIQFDNAWVSSHLLTDYSHQMNRSDFKTVSNMEVMGSRIINRSYLILVWTPFFGDWQYGMPRSAWKPLHTSFCHYESCAFTNNRSLLRQADALVFHCRNIQPWPEVRYTHQIWVLYCLESPYHANFAHFNNRMNATATYRRDSDIFVPYHDLLLKTRSSIKSYTPRVPWNGKNRSVAWAVSNCHTPSKRNLYVDALAKYIDVDIFGRCGKLKCPRGENCNRKLERQYKFYLSFENSVCIDYVTEKFFIAADYELIPIVLGGTNYSKHMPPKSFIDVRDFSSPKKLAEKLRTISSNQSEYYEYFKWKPFYENKPAYHQKLFCGVCELLKNGSYFKTYGDIQAWYKTPPCDGNFVPRMLGQVQ